MKKPVLLLAVVRPVSALFEAIKTAPRLFILFTAWLMAAVLLPDAVRATIATNNISLGIKTTARGAIIPPDFVGLAFSRGAISGAGGSFKIFDPSAYTNEIQLTNLFIQIGVHHIRTICGPYVTNDPTCQQDDTFFAFCTNAAVDGVIYSMSCYREPLDSTNDVMAATNIWLNPNDYPVLEAFALDNEPDFLGTIDFNKTDITVSNYWSYRQRWWGVYKNIETNLDLLGLPRAPFAGPDTGCSWPAFSSDQPSQNDSVDDQSKTAPDGSTFGIPFSVHFAGDGVTNLGTNYIEATQHYYEASGAPAPTWNTNYTYYAGDEAWDTNAGAPYVALVNIFAGGKYDTGAPPNIMLSDPSNEDQAEAILGTGVVPWTNAVTLWTSGQTWQLWTFVQDGGKDGKGMFYQFTNWNNNNGIYVNDTKEPADDSGNWEKHTDPSGPSAGQMAYYNLSTNRFYDWTNINNWIVGTNTWPTNPLASPYRTLLPFRFTEVSAYDNGAGDTSEAGVQETPEGDTFDINDGNTNGQNFSTALWELNWCHWWARHGCSGVDPFSRTVQHSAPIYELGVTQYVVEPYAYGLKAFNVSAPAGGACINASGVTNSANWTNQLDSYAVVYTNNDNTEDIYVTLINRTYQQVGAYAYNVQIYPGSFTPTGASNIVLTSSDAPNPMGEGDASILGSAQLGGATITNTAVWTPTWNPMTIGTAGAGFNTCTALVQGCSAMIVDIHGHY
jgi:hypothetical protein